MSTLPAVASVITAYDRSGPAFEVFRGATAQEVALIEEVQWLEETATGVSILPHHPAVVAMAALASGLLNVGIGEESFVGLIAREARLHNLLVDPTVLAHRLWSVGQIQRAA